MTTNWTEHLGLKIASVVLAGVMWSVLSGAGAREDEETDASGGSVATAPAAAPVTGHVWPAGESAREWTLTGVPVAVVGGTHGSVHPSTVTVRVHGTKTDVEAAFPDIKVIAEVAARNGHDDVASVRVLAPATVRVVAVDPPDVHVGAREQEGKR